MKRALFAAFVILLLAVPAMFVSGTAQVRHREDTVSAPVISHRIRDRMEQRRLERVPQLGTATRLPGGGPGYESVLIKGQVRTFMRYTPNKVLISSKKAPVIFALHGARGTASQFQSYIGLNAIADREGFIVVYPQGLDKVWNDGRPPDVRGARVETMGEDVEFLNSLADALVAQGAADPARMYISGVSNGGFMALRLACESSSRFAAVGAVIASVPHEAKLSCKPGRAVPVVMINGTEDQLIRYDGGVGRAGIKGNLPVPDAARLFADLDGCSAVTDIAADKLVASDPTSVTLRVWTGCKDGSGVALYSVKGGGHHAPATDPVPGAFLLGYLLGPRSRQIDSAETLWGFFKQYGR